MYLLRLTNPTLTRAHAVSAVPSAADRVPEPSRDKVEIEETDGPGAGGGYDGDEVDGPGAGGGYDGDEVPEDGPGAGGGYDADEVAPEEGPGAGGGYDGDEVPEDGPGAGGGYEYHSAGRNEPLAVFSWSDRPTNLSLSYSNGTERPGQWKLSDASWSLKQGRIGK